MARCRLCTSNDDEAVIEHLAEKLWDSRIERLEGPWAWKEAGATWQAAVTLEIHADEAAAELAKARIAVLQGGTPTVLYAEPMPDWYHA